MGFFTESEIQKEAKAEIDVDQLEPLCKQCGLGRKCNTPKMKISGQGKKGILVINSCPSETDDDYGVIFSDEVGDFFKKKLKVRGINLNKDCWKINAVNCHTRKIDKKHIKSCNPYIKKTILKLKPRFIILLGFEACSSFFGDFFSKNPIDRWRGLCVPDMETGAYILPIYNPRLVEYDNKNKNLQCLYDRDLDNVVKCLSYSKFARKSYEKYVEVVKDYKRVVSILRRVLQRNSTVYFDYETTGIKPFKNGHAIASIALAVSPTKAFAFPYQFRDHWTKKEFGVIQDLWSKILKNPKIKKMAHSLKFEDTWSIVRAKGKVANWYWDTMMAAHCLDNRSKYSGLKFQTYLHLGVVPYDGHVAKYLRSSGEFNTVMDAPLDDLLLYNGLDCIFGWTLFDKQKTLLSGRKELISAIKFFNEGQISMSLTQRNGIPTDADYYDDANEEILEKVGKLKKKLERGREARAFHNHFGRHININSGDDLGKLFYEVLGKPAVKTAKGNYKTDKDTIGKLGLPFVDRLLDMKVWEKARGTYISQFQREICRGKMYPIFDLHIPVTYRGSASRPSFQNIPKRVKEIMLMLRRGMRPSPGCFLSEKDFSGAEVITSACYHKDPTFIYDITKGDMHRDLGAELFFLKSDEVTKMIRFFAKNKWTFAQFYGDWFGACAPNLWEFIVDGNLETTSGILVRDHLADNGIYELGEMTPDGPTEDSFLEHCAAVEDRMWNERFPLYTQWKKDIVEFYQEHGYIDSYTGFRFQGLMSRNQCCNYPIQGTSFHFLVYTMNQIMKELKRYKMKSKVIGQIHDAVIGNIRQEEAKDYDQLCDEIVNSLQSKFDWLIVPMEIESEKSLLFEDGGNFAEMEEYKINEIIYK